MKLKDTINKERICILKSNNKEKVLLDLIEFIYKSGKIPSIDILKKSIFYREKLMSTGIGLGIAVPHVRIKDVHEPITAIGISHKGISDYESIDGKFIKIVVMIVAGDKQHKEYIKLLSQIVTKLKSNALRRNLINAKSSDEIYNILMKEENV